MHVIVLHADSDVLAGNATASSLLPDVPATSMPAVSAGRTTFGSNVVAVAIVTPATDSVGVEQLRAALAGLPGQGVLYCLRGAAAPKELTGLVAEALSAPEDGSTDVERLRRSVAMVAKTGRMRAPPPLEPKRRGPSALTIAGVGGALAIAAMVAAALSVPAGKAPAPPPEQSAAAPVEPTPSEIVPAVATAVPTTQEVTPTTTPATAEATPPSPSPNTQAAPASAPAAQPARPGPAKTDELRSTLPPTQSEPVSPPVEPDAASTSANDAADAGASPAADDTAF